MSPPLGREGEIIENAGHTLHIDQFIDKVIYKYDKSTFTQELSNRQNT